jgi:hypothetical protein
MHIWYWLVVWTTGFLATDQCHARSSNRVLQAANRVVDPERPLFPNDDLLWRRSL